MNVARQALTVARIEAGQGTPEEKARVMAWDRLDGMLSTLDSKVSVLLRFNAIVVAALALDLGALPAALPPGEGGRAEGQADQERHQGTEHARAVHEAPSSQCFAMAGAVDPAASTLMRIE